MQELIKLLATNSDEKFTKDLLNALLTKTELKAISRRWEIVKLLRQGLSQRAIAKKLKTSLCNITRGAKELKKKNNIFAQILK